MKQLTCGSLFAGIGGFDLGFERAGIKTIWQVEIDEYCRRVLAKHFPGAERFGDIRECCGENSFSGRCRKQFHLPKVDVICGGFPCQDISTGNTAGQGVDGQRSGLWWEMRRIISELRPRYVVVENVANLFNRGFERVIGSLSEIGYDAEWQVISASSFGAPHVRRRVWIVAYPKGKPLLQLSEALVLANSERQRQSGSRKDREPVNSTSDAFGEAVGIIDAVQRGALPYVCRRHDGVPPSMDRMRGLGNSIIPQIAEWIGRRIVEAESASDALLSQIDNDRPQEWWK